MAAVRAGPNIQYVFESNVHLLQPPSTDSVRTFVQNVVRSLKQMAPASVQNAVDIVASRIMDVVLTGSRYDSPTVPNAVFLADALIKSLYDIGQDTARMLVEAVLGVTRLNVRFTFHAGLPSVPPFLRRGFDVVHLENTHGLPPLHSDLYRIIVTAVSDGFMITAARPDAQAHLLRSYPEMTVVYAAVAMKRAHVCLKRWHQHSVERNMEFLKDMFNVVATSLQTLDAATLNDNGVQTFLHRVGVFGERLIDTAMQNAAQCPGCVAFFEQCMKSIDQCVLRARLGNNVHHTVMDRQITGRAMNRATGRAMNRVSTHKRGVDDSFGRNVRAHH